MIRITKLISKFIQLTTKFRLTKLKTKINRAGKETRNFTVFKFIVGKRNWRHTTSLVRYWKLKKTAKRQLYSIEFSGEEFGKRSLAPFRCSLNAHKSLNCYDSNHKVDFGLEFSKILIATSFNRISWVLNEMKHLFYLIYFYSLERVGYLWICNITFLHHIEQNRWKKATHLSCVEKKKN